MSNTKPVQVNKRHFRGYLRKSLNAYAEEGDHEKAEIVSLLLYKDGLEEALEDFFFECARLIKKSGDKIELETASIGVLQTLADEVFQSEYFVHEYSGEQISSFREYIQTFFLKFGAGIYFFLTEGLILEVPERLDSFISHQVKDGGDIHVYLKQGVTLQEYTDYGKNIIKLTNRKKAPKKNLQRDRYLLKTHDEVLQDKEGFKEDIDIYIEQATARVFKERYRVDMGTENVRQIIKRTRKLQRQINKKVQIK